MSLSEAFTIFPAVHLRNGAVVRLTYGDPEKQTVYSHDPVALVMKWQEMGATWIQLVNLDAAFGEAADHNWSLVKAICQIGVSIQFGGGIRTMNDVDWAFKSGIERVIIGTAAVENPRFMAEAITAYGAERVILALDTDAEGIIRTHGWKMSGGVQAIGFGRQMRQLGVTTAIHTSINRDGSMTGIDWQASASLAQYTGLNVIAGGGVSGLNDIRECIHEPGISGVVIGRAFHTGRVDLKRAMRLAVQPPVHMTEIGLWTRDLAQTQTYYETIFGAELLEDNSPESCCRLQLSDDLTLRLICRPDLVRLQIMEGQLVGMGYVRLSVGGLSRLESLVDSLKRHGQGVVPLTDQTAPEQTVYQTSDPDGNIIQLTA